MPTACPVTLSALCSNPVSTLPTVFHVPRGPSFHHTYCTLNNVCSVMIFLLLGCLQSLHPSEERYSRSLTILEAKRTQHLTCPITHVFVLNIRLIKTHAVAQDGHHSSVQCANRNTCFSYSASDSSYESLPQEWGVQIKDLDREDSRLSVLWASP